MTSVVNPLHLPVEEVQLSEVEWSEYSDMHVGSYRRFGGACRLHIQGGQITLLTNYQSTQHHILQCFNLHGNKYENSDDNVTVVNVIE
jgi:hypothetical protein